ncbi:MAG: MerR family transcriptional regulator [Bacteroidetes bacterium]|jgi:DNA-binding transcriptional MerR regulator|nr:MerR family transcriptional regulator [Bacteroidota bacterium]
MNHFSIKDVEALTGIKPHTLRIWEQRYGIPQPKRTATNIRYYDDDDIKMLLSVAMLNRQGHKISKITKMGREELDRLVMELTLDATDRIVQIESLTKAMFSLDEVAFEKILAANFLQHGMQDSFLNLVFPFLARVGMLWQTGSVNPAYEHFITNLIRQKLFVAIDAQPKNIAPGAKRFLLFLPAHEPHEIGLLFANYLIRSRGHHTSYLGPNLPLDDLSPVMTIYKADFLLTVLTTSIAAHSPLTIANKLSKDFPHANILIGGGQILQANIHFPKNVRTLSTMQELISLLDYLKVN